MNNRNINIGIDIGSITTKLVAVDTVACTLLWSGYRRHHARQIETAMQLLSELRAVMELPEDVVVVVTGSGAQQAAEQGGLPYVQEVNALVRAVRTLHPDVRSVIELGGEDSKMISIDVLDSGEISVLPVMNEKCAAGTGSMIDRMTARMDLTPDQAAAIEYVPGVRHPIAAKCGVFAETDVVGLLKSGVDRDELLRALYEAIVQQNLSSLARGRTPVPKVLLLGGPHLHYPGLVQCWRHRLRELWTLRGVDALRFGAGSITVPEHAVFLPAIGAVLEHHVGGSVVRDARSIEERLRAATSGREGKRPSRIAFSSEAERERFTRDFTPPEFFPPDVSGFKTVRGHLGIDCGSTSIKAVLLDEQMKVLRKEFAFATHDPLEDVRRILFRLRQSVTIQGASLDVLSLGVTGYAKDILAAVLRADAAMVETVAHKQAATAYYPDAEVICDVGGQDIKVMLLREGTVSDFRLNTQCSAGTGYFLQTAAARFDTSIYQFADLALSATYAPDFSAGCTIFLQSDIVNFMRAGYTPAEILAGVTQVLPVNVWTYAARMYDLPSAGRVFVLQGGTQRNLAAVRAQVNYIRNAFIDSGKDPVVHLHPHPAEAGAIGCAMLAAAEVPAFRGSRWIGFAALDSLVYEIEQSEQTTCGGCGNRCARTVIHLLTEAAASAHRHPCVIVAPCEHGRTDDREERRLAVRKAKNMDSRIPDYARVLEEAVFSPENIAKDMRGMFGNGSASWPLSAAPPDVCICLPRVLNFHVHASLFIAWFLAMGFRPDQIKVSQRTTRVMSSAGTARATIDPCFPAKICFAHIEALLRDNTCADRRKWLFFPAILRLPTLIDDNVDSMACTVAAVMPEVVHAAYMLEGNEFARYDAHYLHPFLSLESLDSFSATMAAAFADLLPASRQTYRRAADMAWALQESVSSGIRTRSMATLRSLELEHRLGIVLLGRPYHADHGLNHGVPEALRSMGYPLFTAETLPRDETLLAKLFADDGRSIRDVWPNPYSENSSRKMWAARFAARHPNLLAVELSNFKCGHDAPAYSIIRDMFHAAHKPFFSFLDLDENTPGNTLNIRIETIRHFLRHWSISHGFVAPDIARKEAICMQQR